MSILPTLLVCSPASSEVTQATQVTVFLKEQKLLALDVHIENYSDLHFLNTEEDAVQIEHARTLTKEMAMSPYQAAQSIFVLFNLDQGSIPAQNALLKSLEEPPSYVVIVATIKSTRSILPTIESRCQVVQAKASAKASTPQTSFNGEEIYNTLLNGTLHDLFALSDQYKDREEALQFCSELLQFLHQKNQQAPHPKLLGHMRALTETQDYLEKNVNVRLALEQCFFGMRKK